MKTDALDYLLSGLVLTLLTGAALAIAILFSLQLSRNYLGAYHVIADALVFLFGFGLAAIAFCRLLVATQRLQTGSFAMDTPAFRWWKLYTVAYEFGRSALSPFTSLFMKPVVARWFGARIGRDIALGGYLVDPQFIQIADEAIIGQDSVITAHTITSGRLTLASVSIGARATVGVNAVIMSGVQIGADAVVAASAVVPPNTQIPPGELWGGVPAHRLK